VRIQPGWVGGVLSEGGTAWQRPQWGCELLADETSLEATGLLPPATPKLAIEQTLLAAEYILSRPQSCDSCNTKGTALKAVK